jgi:hypothetical protein
MFDENFLINNCKTFEDVISYNIITNEETFFRFFQETVVFLENKRGQHRVAHIDPIIVHCRFLFCRCACDNSFFIKNIIRRYFFFEKKK